MEINRGFESMLPRRKKTKANLFYQNINFSIFDTIFSFSIKVSKGED